MHSEDELAALRRKLKRAEETTAQTSRKLAKTIEKLNSTTEELSTYRSTNVDLRKQLLKAEWDMGQLRVTLTHLEEHYQVLFEEFCSVKRDADGEAG